MTVGSNTFKGLALPLNGESEIKQLAIANDILTLTSYASNTSDYLVLRDSDGTENFFVKSTGNVRINATNDASHFCMDVRDTGSATTGWNGGGNFELTVSDLTQGNCQTAALRACLNASGFIVGTGRMSVLSLYLKAASSTVHAARSFIHVDDDGGGAASFLAIGGNLAAGASFWVGDGSSPIAAVASRGIRIYHQTTPYYIMVTSCVS